MVVTRSSATCRDGVSQKRARKIYSLRSTNNPTLTPAQNSPLSAKLPVVTNNPTLTPVQNSPLSANPVVRTVKEVTATELTLPFSKRSKTWVKKFKETLHPEDASHQIFQFAMIYGNERTQEKLHFHIDPSGDGAIYLLSQATYGKIEVLLLGNVEGYFKRIFCMLWAKFVFSGRPFVQTRVNSSPFSPHLRARYDKFHKLMLLMPTNFQKRCHDAKQVNSPIWPNGRMAPGPDTYSAFNFLDVEF